jgi:hypothetical protein
MTAIAPTDSELELIQRLKDHHMLLLIADLQRAALPDTIGPWA